MAETRQTAEATGTERKALHAYLSDRAHDAWAALSEENGVSMTGILESLGQQLADELEAGTEADDLRQEWIKPARKVDAARRRRGPARAA